MKDSYFQTFKPIEHLWLASSQYIDRLSTGRKHWADELIVYLNLPRIVSTEPLLNADTTVGIVVGLLVEPRGIEPLTSCMPCKRSPS